MNVNNGSDSHRRSGFVNNGEKSHGGGVSAYLDKPCAGPKPMRGKTPDVMKSGSISGSNRVKR